MKIKLDKKQIIILIVVILMILISIIFINIFGKKNYFKNYMNNISEVVINTLDNKTISGDVDFSLDVFSNINNMKIIDDVKYKGIYQFDFNQNFINFNLDGVYNNNNLKSNIYIHNNKLYILLNGVYDKYISYDLNYLDFLNNVSDYKKLLKDARKVLDDSLDDKYYIYDDAVIDDKKVRRITLDLTNEKIKNSLVKNKKVKKDIDTIKNHMDGYSWYKLATLNVKKLYIYIDDGIFGSEFFGFDLEAEEIDLKIRKDGTRYNYNYYVRDGIIYRGYFDIDGDKLIGFTLEDVLNNMDFRFKINNYTVNYNEKVSNMNLNSIISNSDLTEDDKMIIKKNKVISDMYDGYLKRDYVEINPKENEPYIFEAITDDMLGVPQDNKKDNKKN